MSTSLEHDRAPFLTVREAVRNIWSWLWGMLPLTRHWTWRILCAFIALWNTGANFHVTCFMSLRESTGQWSPPQTCAGTRRDAPVCPEAALTIAGWGLHNAVWMNGTVTEWGKSASCDPRKNGKFFFQIFAESASACHDFFMLAQHTRYKVHTVRSEVVRSVLRQDAGLWKLANQKNN